MVFALEVVKVFLHLVIVFLGMKMFIMALQETRRSKKV